LRQRRGPLLAIGGAEDKFRDRVILSRFVEMSGGSSARIVVIPTASSLPDAGHLYVTVFKELGARSADVLTVTTREDAGDDRLVDLIENSTGIFLTGGNQIRIAAMLGGTRVAAMLDRKNLEGTPVAGTSAGASVMSSVMIAGGRSGDTPRRQLARMSPGLGLVDSMIIDQHFRERNRVGRLVTMVSYNPGLLGLGIDEDTAAIITAEGLIEVIGRGSVLVVDGINMMSDVYSGLDRQPVTMSNVTIHFVAEGSCFSLEQRKVTSWRKESRTRRAAQ
jgi:cyanophycinase